MSCHEVTHPEAIRLLRLMTAAGWNVEIRTSQPPFEVTAVKGDKTHTANGPSIAQAICNLSDECGVDPKQAT